MGTKPKTRFTINVGGRARELFSVRETSQGDLLLLIKKTEEMTFGDHHGKLIEQRYSVHPSPETEGFTFTQRITFEGEVPADTYSHIRPIGGRFCWPFFARACPALSADHYLSDPKQRDTLISLGSYNPDKATLCYLAIATDRQTNIRHEVAALPMNAHAVRFREFSFWLLHGFICLPSSPIGSISMLSTHSPRLDGKSLLQTAGRGFAICPAEGELVSYADLLLSNLADDLFARLKAWMVQSDSWDSTNDPAARQLARTISKAPLYQ